MGTLIGDEWATRPILRAQLPLQAPYKGLPSRHAYRGTYKSQETQKKLTPAHVITPIAPMTGLILLWRHSRVIPRAP